MPRRRGLLRTAGRAAVISGAMTAASGRVARSQHQKFARQDAVASRRRVATDTGSAGADIAESLQLLAQMRADGSLSEKEFVAAKRKLLAT
jgi:hypothetical protein